MVRTDLPRSAPRSRPAGAAASVTTTTAPFARQSRSRPPVSRATPSSRWGRTTGMMLASSPTTAAAAITVGRRLPSHTSPSPHRITAAKAGVSQMTWSPALHDATPLNHASMALVGRWSSVANGSPATPAAVPAVSPHIISGPATGPARRFAGTETIGTGPKTTSSNGSTPTCAASVTASGSGRRARSHGASTARPTQALTERPNPIEWTRSGSTTTSAPAATARTRSGDTSRPIVVASRVTAAMPTARMTDGSQRVIVPNSTSAAMTAP